MDAARRRPLFGAARSQPFREKERTISSKLFVGNLNYKTTSDQIQTLFAEAGEVVEVIVPTDRATGRPRGFAFVEFATPGEAADAMEKFDGYELDGRELRVNEAESRPPRRQSFNDGPSFSGGNPHVPPARPKGSRRNLRGKKRSL